MSTLHRESGYTLIEIMVVLAIVGILTFAGVNASINRPAPAVRGVTNDIYGVLRAAQTLARNSGRRVVLMTSGRESSKNLRLDYGFYVQKSDGTDDTSQGPGATAANPVMGSFVIENSLSRNCQIGDAATGQFATVSPNPSPGSDTVLGGMESSSWWGNSANNLFQGSTARIDIFFQSDGNPNVDFYVPVVGLNSASVSTGRPVGLVLASKNNGLLMFMKASSSNAAVAWSRL